MVDYDYESGKERVENILDNDLEVLEKKYLPSDKDFTFDNGYISWVTGLFVDIRDSSSLFSNNDNEAISKIVRSFTSEIIEILRKDGDLKEIGIRGDCVYAIYNTPFQSDIWEVANKSFWVNTYMNLLNKLLFERNYPKIKAGIGVASAMDLVVKAGRKNVGINDKVWIGEAVSKASKLSSLGNKNDFKKIVFSSLSYNNFIDELIDYDGEEAKGWFKKHLYTDFGTLYSTNIIKTEFNEWINNL